MQRRLRVQLAASNTTIANAQSLFISALHLVHDVHVVHPVHVQ